jgi:hypothetical protein
MPLFPPGSPNELREFLRERFPPERLRRVASADYDRDGDGIAQEFKRNLDTGLYGYTGDGNPYEVALMQRHDMTADRPLDELFGAWWLGTFCSDPKNFVLINNLAPWGVDSLLGMVVRGCGELGEEAAKAANASIPFVRFVRSRTEFAEESHFDDALAALEAIKCLGAAGAKTERYQKFIARFA